jgi:two-component system, cell cycle response regulator DivK
MKSILIVEDEAISAILLRKLLEKDFNVDVAQNANDGINFANSNVYNICILDINLGKGSKDGKELLAHFKANPDYSKTKYVAITAYALPGDKEKYISMGFDQYFSKPIVFEEVINCIKELAEDDTVRTNS